MNDLKQTVQSAVDSIGSGLTDAINDLADALQSADDFLDELKHNLAKNFINFALDLGDGINDVEKAVNDFFTAARNFTRRRDPLTLDLDGDGLETIGIDPANPILFDHDADGVKTATGWIKPDDGFLVMDRNGDGIINDGTELFGDSTPLYTGGTAADGFAALAQEDTNGDGLVNAADARFAELRIWRDLNQDGESQAGELQTLEEAGIAALHVGKTENSKPLANGNLLADLGSYTRTDGTEGGLGAVSGKMGDIDLADNPFYSEFIDAIPLTAEAQALPDMNGSGLVRDLRQAASLSGELAGRVASLNATLDAPVTRARMLSEIDGLIDGWADTSGMTTSIEAAQAQGYTLRYLPPGASAADIAWLYGGMDSGGGSGGATEITSPQELARLEALRQSLAHVEHLIGLLERFNGMTFVDVTSLGVRRGNGQFTALTDATSSTGQTGESMTSRVVYIGLDGAQVSFLEQSYAQLKQSVYDGLVLQTRLKPYLDQIGLVLDESGISLDLTAMDAAFQGRYDAAPAEAVRDLLDLQRVAGANLNGIGWDGYGQLRGWLIDAADSADPALRATLVAGLADFGYPSLRAQGDGTVGNDVVIGADTGATLSGAAGNDLQAANDAVFEMRRVG